MQRPAGGPCPATPGRHAPARAGPRCRALQLCAAVSLEAWMAGTSLALGAFDAAVRGGRGRIGCDRSAPFDLFDLVSLGSARRHHLDARALALADERTGERRRDRYLAFLGVGLGLADKLPHLFLFGVLVDQRHGRSERDGIARELRHVDYLGARELVLELRDAALVVRLRLLGGMVFGVLRQIAMGARVGNLLDDTRPLDLLAVLELILERRVAR